MQEPVVVVICLLALLGADVYFELFWRKDLERKEARRLSERTCLNSEEFWGGFYAASNLPRRRAEDALNVLSRAIGVPPGKLRPGDRFLVELAPRNHSWGALDDSDFSLAALSEKLENDYGVAVDFKRVKTVDDYIRRVCEGPRAWQGPAEQQHAQPRP